MTNKQLCIQKEVHPPPPHSKQFFAMAGISAYFKLVDVMMKLLWPTQLAVYSIGYYSRSYAKDVTSVTSGASQGPHSFNSVIVCLCHRHAWRYPAPVPYRTIKDSWSQYSNRAFKCKFRYMIT